MRAVLRVLGKAILISAVIAFLAAVGLQRAYLGYWLIRPTVVDLMPPVRTVLSLTRIEGDNQKGWPRAWTMEPVDVENVELDFDQHRAKHLIPHEFDSRLQRLFQFLDWRYYRFFDTIELWMKKRTERSLPVMSEFDRETIQRVVDSSKQRRRGKSPVSGAAFSGTVLGFEAIDGKSYAAACLNGWMFDIDDHYPHYDVLLRMPRGDIIDWRTTYYDVAGIEILSDWYMTFPLFMLLLTVFYVAPRILWALASKP